MKKRYYLSMMNTLLLVFIIDFIYLISHQTLNMLIPMLISHFIVYGLINFAGCWFLYKPIEIECVQNIPSELSLRRISKLTKYSTIWVFMLGLFYGTMLLIGVFFFQMASDVGSLEKMPIYFLIQIIPSSIFVWAILPSFITYFLVTDFIIDLKEKIFNDFNIRYPVGKMKIGRVLIYVFIILGILPAVLSSLDLATMTTITEEEYAKYINISHEITMLIDQFIVLAGFIFALLLIGRSFTKPIYSLLETINKVGKGDYSARAAVISEDEIGLLTQNFNDMVEELEASHNKQAEYSQNLEKNVEQLNKEITEREKAEKLASEQQKKLFQAEKMASVGILVSGVAHEINNPNNFILLNGENLSDVWNDLLPFLDKYTENHGDFMIAGLNYSEIRDEVSLIINGIKEGSERIKKIVQTLKDFARIDPGNLDQMVDIPEVIDASVTILASLIKKSSDRFSIKIPENIPKIQGNFQQVEQVVINLLSNACHALVDRNKAISIFVEIEKKFLAIKVQDEGTGILPENLKHIMDPFFTTKRDSGGTGLGLSISYNIVKDHGGELLIKSEIGKGTTAIIKLPV